jgi:hypothetical protein
MYARQGKARTGARRSVAANAEQKKERGGIGFVDNRSLPLENSWGSERKIVQRYRYPNARAATAQDILKAFDFNWFEAKQDLVYEYESGREDEGLKLMKKLINYRKRVVDKVLLDVMKETAKKLGSKGGEIYPTEVGYRYQDLSGVKHGKGTIEANAPGSTNVTSDYDITFSIPGAPEAEIDAVSLFNKKFGDQWKRPSAVVFDTNVYTSGFMSAEARKTYEKELGALSEPTQSKRGRIQLALSLLPICQFIARRDKADWELFKQVVSEDARDYMESRGITQQECDYVCIEMSEIFTETDRLFSETEVGIAHDIGLSKQPGGKSSTEVMAKEVEFLNKRYQKQLDEVKAILEDRRQILTMRSLSRKDRRTLLAENLTLFERAQGKALVYAQEAYYSAGPVIHVVEGMQAGGNVVLTPNQKLQSILMNIGYKLQHYEHIRKEPGKSKEEQAKIGTSKYGQRIGHEAAWQQEENELKDVSTVKDLLKSEKRLVALKKGKLTGQKEKVAIAKETEAPVMAMDKFVAIAIETITPYLIAQYRAKK